MTKNNKNNKIKVKMKVSNYYKNEDGLTIDKCILQLIFNELIDRK